MEFIALKVAGGFAALVIAVGLWRKYAPDFAKSELEKLFSNADALTGKFDAYIAKKTVEVAKKADEIFKAQTTKDALENDLAKAKELLDKLKGLFH